MKLHSDVVKKAIKNLFYDVIPTGANDNRSSMYAGWDSLLPHTIDFRSPKMFNLNSRPFPAIKSRFREEKGFPPFHPPHGEWNSVGGILFCTARQLNSGEWLIENFYAFMY